MMQVADYASCIQQGIDQLLTPVEGGVSSVLLEWLGAVWTEYLFQNEFVRMSGLGLDGGFGFDEFF